MNWEGTSLNSEERNLLSVAYKNEITDRRAASRTLAALAQDSKGNSDLIKGYKDMVEEELQTICQEILTILTKTLIPQVQQQIDDATKAGKKEEAKEMVEAQVFYLKMTGDYHRYLAEIFKTTECINEAKETYKKALEIAEKELSSTHPIRLGLALNFSVCYFEILGDKKEACKLAKEAFDKAIAQLDAIDEASYKDSTLIMQLLRDNLALWQNSDDLDDGDAVDDAGN